MEGISTSRIHKCVCVLICRPRKGLRCSMEALLSSAIFFLLCLFRLIISKQDARNVDNLATSLCNLTRGVQFVHSRNYKLQAINATFLAMAFCEAGSTNNYSLLHKVGVTFIRIISLNALAWKCVSTFLARNKVCFGWNVRVFGQKLEIGNSSFRSYVFHITSNLIISCRCQTTTTHVQKCSKM